jgi:hypothetical protein
LYGGPAIYIYRVGADVYVGKSRNGVRRALGEYRNNVRKRLAGAPYRKSKPNDWRVVHLRLADAVMSGEHITLELRVSTLEALDADEQRLIKQLRASLNVSRDSGTV